MRAPWRRRAHGPAPGGLLAMTGEVICARDADGTVRFATPSAREVLGMAPEELRGRPLDVHLHPDDRMEALAAWQRLLAGGTAPALELRWARPDGGVLWVEMVSAPLAAGSAGFATRLRDITRRRQAEAELTRLRDDLTGAIAAGPGVLYRLLPQGGGRWRPGFVSANVERMTGYSVAAVIEAGNWPDCAMAPEDITPRWQAIQAALDGGTGLAEYALRRADGGWITVSDHLRRRDRAGSGTELVGYLQDITELRAAERQLAQARQEVDTLTATGPGVLYRSRIDATGRRDVLFAAEGAARVLGHDVGTIIGPGRFEELCDPAGLAATRAALRNLPEDGTVTLEFRLREGGGWRWVRDTVRAVGRTADGVALAGYWTDITRERELARQLAEAAKLALLGEMATGMAHELKQPLGSIGLASEVAMMALEGETPDAETARAKLARIAAQTQRTAQLIDHMRIFGRRQDGPPGAVDFAAAVEGAAAIVAGKLTSRRVVLHRDLPPGLPRVHGQLILVEQVLINLIGNACDAYAAVVPRGGDPAREVRITAAPRDGMLVATVSDRAGGIPEDVIGRVFEPFFTTKTAEHGTGLGLSISYGIVRDMGGTMMVRNEDGGAVFELLLPLHHAGPEAQ